MILKIEVLELATKNVGYEKEGWRFIDKVADLRLIRVVEKDPDGKDYNLLRIEILKDSIADSTVTVHGESVYLLSDEGKTIERVN